MIGWLFRLIAAILRGMTLIKQSPSGLVVGQVPSAVPTPVPVSIPAIAQVIADGAGATAITGGELTFTATADSTFLVDFSLSDAVLAAGTCAFAVSRTIDGGAAADLATMSLAGTAARTNPRLVVTDSPGAGVIVYSLTAAPVGGQLSASAGSLSGSGTQY